MGLEVKQEYSRGAMLLCELNNGGEFGKLTIRFLIKDDG